MALVTGVTDRGGTDAHMEAIQFRVAATPREGEWGRTNHTNFCHTPLVFEQMSTLQRGTTQHWSVLPQGNVTSIIEAARAAAAMVEVFNEEGRGHCKGRGGQGAEADGEGGEAGDDSVRWLQERPPWPLDPAGLDGPTWPVSFR